MPGGPHKPGDKVGGRYTIADVHSIGGMSALYKAHDDQSSDPNRCLALKEEIIQPEEPGKIPNLLDEARQRIKVLKDLDHSAIPKIEDSFTADDSIYIVMEFIDGKDLEDILNETTGHLPIKKIYGWAIELCEVLNYLHGHQPGPVIFRDLKPSNIMIDREDKLRLVDYGIAGVFSKDKIYDPLGTDGYAAPEQYNGLVTPAIDIYALGATLHHLLTKRDPRLEPPFSFNKNRISDLNPAVPWQLEDIVMQALAFDPQDRFTSIGKMMEALQKIEDQIDK
ncbi:MAG: serine/threonine protein kinase [Anaerolineae bacterium]|nr:serine/threonine protein kinase [Anaerolineae bacterium]